ncbi:MAG TPA: ATP-binding protein, partial [Tahibacter sp.]|nr:ATP-binding protein [Tahibacter sp.]
ELAQLAVGDLRGLLHELRTPEAATATGDEALPLVDAVNRLLRLMVPTALATRCDFAAYAEQQPEQEQALLRIVQEAVSNAVRHAAATHLQVSAAMTAEQVVVRIEDDGRGLPRRRRRGVGLGLESMRARAQALGGQLKTRRGTDRGTCIEVWLPRRDRETGA